MSFRTNLRPRPRAPAGNTEGATSEEHRAGVRAEAEGMGGLVREIRGDVLEKGDARKLDKMSNHQSSAPNRPYSPGLEVRA